MNIDAADFPTWCRIRRVVPSRHKELLERVTSRPRAPEAIKELDKVLGARLATDCFTICLREDLPTEAFFLRVQGDPEKLGEARSACGDKNPRRVPACLGKEKRAPYRLFGLTAPGPFTLDAARGLLETVRACLSDAMKEQVGVWCQPKTDLDVLEGDGGLARSPARLHAILQSVLGRVAALDGPSRLMILLHAAFQGSLDRPAAGGKARSTEGPAWGFVGAAQRLTGWTRGRIERALATALDDVLKVARDPVMEGAWAPVAGLRARGAWVHLLLVDFGSPPDASDLLDPLDDAKALELVRAVIARQPAPVASGAEWWFARGHLRACMPSCAVAKPAVADRAFAAIRRRIEGELTWLETEAPVGAADVARVATRVDEAVLAGGTGGDHLVFEQGRWIAGLHAAAVAGRLGEPTAMAHLVIALESRWLSDLLVQAKQRGDAAPLPSPLGAALALLSDELRKVREGVAGDVWKVPALTEGGREILARLEAPLEGVVNSGAGVAVRSSGEGERRDALQPPQEEAR